MTNKIETIKISGIDYVDYTEADLRFTGWEHECIIIDRTKNHYLIPLERYNELEMQKLQMKENKKEENVSTRESGLSGCCGWSGIIGTCGKEE